jgi:predicted GIY-YIG superfamily endonuclease
MDCERTYYVYIMASKSRVVYVGDAIARETEIKKWRREKKVALIEERNPTWEDLGEGWGEAAVMKVSRKAGSSPGLQPGSE